MGGPAAGRQAAFSSRYDDVELLGKAVIRGDGWYRPGSPCTWPTARCFGAAYATLAPALPVPPALRGPGRRAGWSTSAVAARRAHRPGSSRAQGAARGSSGNRRAFAQATWRHLLFGSCLGELERRVNAAPEPAPPEPEADYSSNGHGSLEHALTVAEAGRAGPARADLASGARPHHRRLRVRRGLSRAGVRRGR